MSSFVIIRAITNIVTIIYTICSLTSETFLSTNSTTMKSQCIQSTAMEDNNDCHTVGSGLGIHVTIYYQSCDGHSTP